MVFNSYIFILGFLPVFIIGYFLLNRYASITISNLYVIIMSCIFYSYTSIKYLPIFFFSVIINYLAYMFLERQKKRRKIILVGIVVINIALLLLFKYYNFFADSINQVFGTDIVLRNLILPLGISFYTFRLLSFVIDAYKGVCGKYSFIEFVMYITYFPCILQGPIVAHDEIIPQFKEKEKRRVNWDNIAKGLYSFIIGLAKKVLLADVFGQVATVGFSNVEALDATNGIIVMLAYTFQIYFDFSGYCDMANGIAKMMNINLPVNFDSPYKSFTIKEFWSRWHVTLTRFFTKYVYIPLGGSRKGNIRTYINIMIIFVISGFWHGANWTFVVWGVLHGIFMVIVRWKKKLFEGLHPALNWLITFLFVNVAWIFFRADSLDDAFTIISRIGHLQFQPINADIIACFNCKEYQIVMSHIPEVNTVIANNPQLMVALFMCIALAITLGCNNVNEQTLDFKPTYLKVIVLPILLVWCILSLSAVSTFIYVGF